MAQQIINNGTFDNDPSAEKIRTAFDKVNDNFTELYNDTGGSLKSIALEFPLTGGNSATTNWWATVTTTGNLFQFAYSNNPNFTDTNNFANLNKQMFARILPFKCKLKNVAIRGFSNTGQGNLDIAVVKSKQSAIGNFIQNAEIIARENISIAGQNGSLLEQSFLEGSLVDTTIDKDSAIRIVFNNNNQAINILSAVVILVFEEVL